MFKNHIEDFNESIIGLRDFVDLIDPFLTEKHDEHDKFIMPIIRVGVLKGLLIRDEAISEKRKNELEQKIVEAQQNVRDLYKEDIDIEVEINNDEEDGRKAGNSFGIKFMPKNEIDFDSHMTHARQSRQHIELLYKNSLISLLSNVEWIFSQILHYFYNKHPKAAGIHKKTITLSDLKSFSSIEDAEKHLIDEKIEDILRGSFETWIDLLKNELHLAVDYIAPINDELNEIYQRRNLMVHNGGLVNSIYLAKVSEVFAKKVEIGEKLTVSKTYLDNAICKLQKTFILVASELWKKLDKEDKQRGDVLGEIVYENLVKDRWDICEGLTKFILEDSLLEVTDKVVAQLNYWLCKKRTNSLSDVQRELTAADYSDKKEIFQLGLYALRDNTVSFFETLPIALSNKQLSIKSLEEFPIFKEMRETTEYAEFKNTHNHFWDIVSESE